MIRLLAGLALACLASPACADPAAPTSCDFGAVAPALEASGVRLLGIEMLRFSPITELLVEFHGTLGVVFVLAGCPEQQPGGGIAVHLLGVPPQPEASS